MVKETSLTDRVAGKNSQIKTQRNFRFPPESQPNFQPETAKKNSKIFGICQIVHCNLKIVLANNPIAFGMDIAN